MTLEDLLVIVTEAKAVGPSVVWLRTARAFDVREVSEVARQLRDAHGVELLVTSPEVSVDALPIPSPAELVADVQRAARARSVQDGVAELKRKYLILKRPPR